MADLTTKYLGLTLKNPVIVSSSTLTENIDSIKTLEENGAAAVVLRSIFEEEITMEADHVVSQAVKEGYDEGLFDYFDSRVKQKNIEDYLDLILECKRQTSIPIIGSINAVSNHEWTYFAKKMESVGVDAIELNMFLLPSDLKRTCTENEQIYFDVIKKLTSEVSVPVTLKMSHYFSNLGAMIKSLSDTEIKGLVLFNKFFAPDFDINTEKVTPTYVLSGPRDISMSLRWIAMMSDRVDCDLAASTGVHDGEGVIKQILAGANAVQVASTLYKKGPEQIGVILNEVESWMDKKGYTTLDDFRGKLSYGKVNDPALLQRVQFMKHFGTFTNK